MAKKMILMALPLAVLAVSACTTERHVDNRAPGKYETVTKKKATDGTNYEVRKTSNVKVDQYGRKYDTLETEVKKDPKGLFNSSKSTTKQVIR